MIITRLVNWWIIRLTRHGDSDDPPSTVATPLDRHVNIFKHNWHHPHQRWIIYWHWHWHWKEFILTTTNTVISGEKQFLKYIRYNVQEQAYRLTVPKGVNSAPFPCVLSLCNPFLLFLTLFPHTPLFCPLICPFNLPSCYTLHFAAPLLYEFLVSCPPFYIYQMEGWWI